MYPIHNLIAPFFLASYLLLPLFEDFIEDRWLPEKAKPLIVILCCGKLYSDWFSSWCFRLKEFRAQLFANQLLLPPYVNADYFAGPQPFSEGKAWFKPGVSLWPDFGILVRQVRKRFSGVMEMFLPVW